jgi:hypothetical protein
MKALLPSITLLMGILVGGALGGSLRYRMYSEQDRVRRGFSWLEIGLAVSENAFGSNSGDATELLHDTLILVDRGVQSSAVDPSMKNALGMTRGQIEAHLSVIEKEAGDAVQARVYMSKAQEDLKDVGWIDYSEDHVLRTFPRRSFPCAPATQTTATNGISKRPCG